MTTRPKIEGQPKGKPKLPPTTEEKSTIITLTAAGVSQTKVAASIGRSRGLVKHTLAEPAVQLAVSEERRAMAEECMSTGRTIVLSISQENIDKAGLKDKAISAGIMFDKGLLLAAGPSAYNVPALLALVQWVRDARREEDRRLTEAKVIQGQT
ncbi:MAG: hypothetical protein WB341_17120 [Terracidiphilus sp.]